MERKIGAALLILVFLTAPCLAQTDSPECKKEYASIENEIAASNYCDTDSDCKVLATAAYIEFGCYHYINKSVDASLLLKKMEDYSSKCTDIINCFGKAPPAKCVSKKCVSKK